MRPHVHRLRLAGGREPAYAAAGHPSPTRGAYLRGYSDMTLDQPATRPVFPRPTTKPANPRFSSGPCAKPPFIHSTSLSGAPLGRSHRAAVGKAKLKAAIETTRDILGVPADYRIGIVPASDTGAVEMAMWSMLGARPADAGLGKLRRGLGHRRGQAAEARRDRQDRALRRDRRPRAGRFRHRRGLHLERHDQRRARAERRCDPGGPRGPDHLRRDSAPPSRRTCPGTSSM
jgi:hypothetical protein